MANAKVFAYKQAMANVKVIADKRTGQKLYAPIYQCERHKKATSFYSLFELCAMAV